MSELLTAWWQYDFMRYALMAVLLIMPLFALLGTFVIKNLPAENRRIRIAVLMNTYNQSRICLFK